MGRPSLLVHDLSRLFVQGEPGGWIIGRMTQIAFLLLALYRIAFREHNRAKL